MKGEKECLLLMNLIDSHFKPKKLLGKQRHGCKKDIEKYLEFSENSKEFNTWINELVEDGCLECVGKEPKGLGNLVDVFVVNEKKSIARLKSISQYKNFLSYFNQRAFMKATFDD